jgi:hypothetical protein
MVFLPSFQLFFDDSSIVFQIISSLISLTSPHYLVIKPITLSPTSAITLSPSTSTFPALHHSNLVFLSIL